MGAWGVKLFDDDVALDIKDEYIELLKYEESNEIATEELIKEYHFMVDDIDDGPIFWFALADTQWKLGRLIPFVKDRVIENYSINLQRWKEESPKDYKKREKVLNELLEKINSPMPEPKKIIKISWIKNDWKIGDTFAYKIEDEPYCDEYEGKYLIINKVDEMYVKKGTGVNLYPIVYVKITNEAKLPDNIYDIDNYDFIRCNNSRYLYRYKFIYKDKDLRSLIYLGNYNLTEPKNEKILENKNDYHYYFKGNECGLIHDYMNYKKYVKQIIFI